MTDVMAMARIALLTPYDTRLHACGGSVIIRYLMNALQSNGMETVLWLCRSTPGHPEVRPLMRESSEETWDWEFSGMPPQSAFSMRRCDPVGFGMLLKDAQKMQARCPVDAVMIFNALTPGLWGMELAESLNIPYFLTLLDYSFLCPVFTRFNRSGDFCEGNIPESECLSCALTHIPAQKRPVFRVLRTLPYHRTLQLGRLLKPLFPASGRHHAAGKAVREQRRDDVKRCFESSAAVIYQSGIMQLQFHKAGFRHSQEAVICYGVPAAETCYKQVQPDDARVQFVYLSRPTREWGLDFLMSVWSQYCDRSSDRHLTILSPGIEAWLTRYPAWKSLSNVTFSSEMIQGRVADFHSRFHVLILPAQWKGIVALTALEALAHGTVVIEPDLGGLSGHVHENPLENGVMPYKWRDGQSLAACMERLCTDRELLQRLMRSAKQIRSLQDWGRDYRQIIQNA